MSSADLPSEPDLNWRIVGAADFNSDGKPDILWRNFATGANMVWRPLVSRERRWMPSSMSSIYASAAWHCQRPSCANRLRSGRQGYAIWCTHRYG